MLKLLTRIVIVAAIPLFFEIGLLCWTCQQNNAMIDDYRSVARSRQVTSELNHLVWDTVQGVAKMHMNSENDDGLMDAATSVEERRKLERRNRKLGEQSWPSEQEGAIKGLRRAIDDLLKVLEWSQQQQSQGRGHWLKVDQDSYQDAYDALQGFVNSVYEIISFEKSRLSIGESSLAERGSTIASVLTAAIPVSLLLTAIIVCFYTLTVRNPLNRIIENGRRLARREKLMSPMSGRDELGDLDRLLHSVSDSVEEARARETSMLDNATDMICSLDRSLVFVKANRDTERILGLSAEEVVDHVLFDFVFAEDQLIVEKLFNEAFESGDGQARQFEIRLQHVDGTIKDSRWSTYWSGAQEQFFSVVRDITHEKNVARLQEDFLNMISHDLRSPLMAIQGSITMIAEGVKGPVSDPMKKHMDIANQNISRMMSFVDDLLEFQRLQSGKMQLSIEKFELVELFKEVVGLVQGVAREKKIDIEVPDGAWTIEGDRQRLLQVVLNLVTNAIKFAPEGTKVELAVSAGSNGTEISVTDSGPGVPEESREQIFEVFQQLKGAKANEGVGLGLGTCKLIVELHGGMIGVRDGRNGVGSCFWFTLNSEPSR